MIRLENFKDTEPEWYRKGDNLTLKKPVSKLLNDKFNKYVRKSDELMNEILDELMNEYHLTLDEIASNTDVEMLYKIDSFFGDTAYYHPEDPCIDFIDFEMYDDKSIYVLILNQLRQNLIRNNDFTDVVIETFIYPPENKLYLKVGFNVQTSFNYFDGGGIALFPLDYLDNLTIQEMEKVVIEEQKKALIKKEEIELEKIELGEKEE